MNIHMSKRLFVVAAVLATLALFAAAFFVALAVRSVVAGPGGTVPSPGHAWTELQGHGDDADGVYVSTQNDEALELRVNNARALRLEPHATSPNLIGGYSGNSVTSGAHGASIGGGGESLATNRVTDDYGTVGGGRNNRAGDNAGTALDAAYATVGGGISNSATASAATVAGGGVNTASGSEATVGGGHNNVATAWGATVSGGFDNEASSTSATVAGGQQNTAASATSATVGGGAINTATGECATVPGGSWNTATGDHSFAAGRRAKANHQGAFVWADSTDADFASTSADQFLVRASGGVGIGTTTPARMLDVAGDARVIGGASADPGLFVNGATAIQGTALERVGLLGLGPGPGSWSPQKTGVQGVQMDWGDYAGYFEGDVSVMGGDVGIGTASPAYELDVNGEANASQLCIAGDCRASWPSGGANTSLSNLSSVAVNSDLLPGATEWIDVGSSGLRFKNSYFRTVDIATDFGGYALNVSSTGFGYGIKIAHSGSSYPLYINHSNTSTFANAMFVTYAGMGRTFEFQQTNSANPNAMMYLWNAGTGHFIQGSNGAYLSNGGTWTNSSDAALKDNFDPVDGREVLARLVEMPIGTWNYKAEDPSIHHVGPVGQDFYGAFGLGEDERHIAPSDTSGVALAAIQGLYELSQEQAERIDALEARLTALEGGAEASGGSAGPLSASFTAAGLLLGGLFLGGLALVQRRRAGGRR